MRMQLLAATLLATGLIGGTAMAQTADTPANTPNDTISPPEANSPPPAPMGDEGMIGPATTTTTSSQSYSTESHTYIVRPKGMISTGTGKVNTAMKPGDTVPKPTCLEGTEPRVWTAPVVYGMPQGKGRVEGIDTWVENQGGQWVIKSAMRAGEGDAPVSDKGQGGWVEVSTMCALPGVTDSQRDAGAMQGAMN
ncbi:hypothetical protein [Nitrospirillum sp. BR 11163]|uniref:hypothetical protein n=1 Tax=Nitrospirillum sp. BR 11163 TaxID=3104323 RepID=UPI002AFE904A|nr:hypothetical protein [Nitrospirillum sp. BR 11163]MEA1673859.1 hypothetical protein [Nitrospirillum sp. BR 11163]